MKKIFFLLLIFLLTDAFFSQSKYFIYFKDKGGEKLEKNSQQYYEVMNTLSPRSIERRKKHLGEDIISIEDLPVNHNYIQVLEAKGCKIIHELKWLNAVSCYLTDLQKNEIVNLNFVKSVESVRKLSVPKFEISDEGFNRLNKIHNTNFDYGPSSAQIQLSDVQLLHNEGINGEGVIIGFLDAGFSYKTHPAFTQLTVLDEYDFVYSDDDVSNDGDASHGTAVLSLAAGFDEGELISPAFKSNYLLAKTEDIRTEKNIEEDNYAAGLEWMEAKGADIVSSSLGYSEFDSLQHSYTYKDMDGKTTVVARASNLAFQKGLVTVTSAGNEGNWPWRYITSPGDAINVITVGAVNSSNQIASFSSRGPTSDNRIKPEIVTMGVSCYAAASVSSGYSYINGTSASAPIVAGIIGQLLSVYPHLTNKKVRSIILESGDNSSKPNNEIGYGLLSAKRVVNFPNIFDSLNSTRIYKSYIPSSLVDNSKLTLQLKFGNSYQSVPMDYDGKLIYSAEIQNLITTDPVLFYFEYSDSLKNLVRDPLVGEYKLHYSDAIVSLTVGLESEVVPEDFYLYQNYPNPFNPKTNLKYFLKESNHVNLSIYNSLGELVKTLVDGIADKGIHELEWDGTDKFGRKISSGFYIAALKNGSKYSARKMIYIK